MIKVGSRNRRVPVVIALVIAGLLIFIMAEALYIKYAGSPVPAPAIPRQEQTLGNGQSLRYAVMGDSTSISQGGDYRDGYATKTAEFLAKSHSVAWINVGVSGARAADVRQNQLPLVLRYQPDVVLIAIGANDVTHLTNINQVRASLSEVIDMLRQQNSSMQIVVTGSPDMGSVPRFPQPVRWLAGNRTESLNRAVVSLAKEKKVIFAPIAKQTGPYFRKHPEAFAADKFHPNTQGYQRWTPVIIDALSK